MTDFELYFRELPEARNWEKLKQKTIQRRRLQPTTPNNFTLKTPGNYIPIHNRLSQHNPKQKRRSPPTLNETHQQIEHYDWAFKIAFTWIRETQYHQQIQPHIDPGFPTIKIGRFEATPKLNQILDKICVKTLWLMDLVWKLTPRLIRSLFVGKEYSRLSWRELEYAGVWE